MDDKDLRIQELKAENKRLTEELEEYQRLEEQGLLLKLPCKVGTTVYEVTNYGVKGHWDEHRWIVDEWSGWIVRQRAFNLFMLADGVLGKTVFLTAEEAQATLEKIKNEALL